jgi:hypothetical protein
MTSACLAQWSLEAAVERIMGRRREWEEVPPAGSRKEAHGGREEKGRQRERGEEERGGEERRGRRLALGMRYTIQ